MECSTEVIINKPIQEVWDYANNPENLKLWLSNFVRYEQLTGDVNAPKVGDKSSHTYDERGKEFSMTEEIIAYDPPNHVTLMLTSKMFDMKIINNMEAISENETRLFAGASTVRAGLFMKVMMMFMSDKKMQDQHVDQVNKLKELIEAQ